MWGETWHALHSSMPADASSAGPICGGDLPKDERQVADRVAQAQHAPRKFTSIGDKPLAINYSDCGDGPQSEYPLSSRL
jgi:hypothetical protein